VNKLYRKQSKKNLSTQHKFIWTNRYEINDMHCIRLLLYVHHITVFALVKALERVQKLHSDKFFILAINRLLSTCSMLITATF